MSTYVVRVHPGSPRCRALLMAQNSRQLALQVIAANRCKMTYFQAASARYPMTFVCEAKGNLAIAKVLRSLDVFGYVQTEIAQIG